MNIKKAAVVTRRLFYLNRENSQPLLRLPVCTFDIEKREGLPYAFYNFQDSRYTNCFSCYLPPAAEGEWLEA